MLSYSCLSDELLIALQQRHIEQSQTSNRNGITWQTLSLHCNGNEPYQQVGWVSWVGVNAEIFTCVSYFLPSWCLETYGHLWHQPVLI